MIGIGIVGFLATYYIPGENWGFLVIKGMVYCVIFAVFSWLFVLNGYEKSLVSEMLVKLHLKKER